SIGPRLGNLARPADAAGGVDGVEQDEVVAAIVLQPHADHSPCRIVDLRWIGGDPIRSVGDPIRSASVEDGARRVEHLVSAALSAENVGALDAHETAGLPDQLERSRPRVRSSDAVRRAIDEDIVAVAEGLVLPEQGDVAGAIYVADQARTGAADIAARPTELRGCSGSRRQEAVAIRCGLSTGPAVAGST